MVISSGCKRKPKIRAHSTPVIYIAKTVEAITHKHELTCIAFEIVASDTFFCLVQFVFIIISFISHCAVQLVK